MDFRVTGTSLHRAMPLAPLHVNCMVSGCSLLPLHTILTLGQVSSEESKSGSIDLEKELAEAYGMTELVYSAEVFERTKVAALEAERVFNVN